MKIDGVPDLTIRDSIFTGNQAGSEESVDIFSDASVAIDCGEGSGNQFCDALDSSTSISTNVPASTCAGASTGEC